MASKLVIGIVLVAVVLGGGYYVTYNNISTAANAVFETFDDGDESIEIINFSLFPPSLEIEMIIPVTNPTDYGFTLSIDADLYYGDTYVDEFHVIEYITPNGRSVIVIPINIGSSLMDSISDDAEWSIEGTRSVSTEMFGIIPVTITKDYSEINN